MKHFRAQSALNQPYICHIGDSNGENPYYNLESSCMEVVLMAAWCRQFANPVILDVTERATKPAEEIVAAVAQALAAEGGDAPLRLPMRALVFLAQAF